MTGPPCSTHADRPAEFRCESCKRRLCADCVETGHRLFICRHCRERALPLAADLPAATHAYARQRRLDRPYGLADALAYPFRGLGRYLVPVWVLTLAAASLLGVMASLVVGALVALLVPGLLFEIVRTTAEGDDELPDWPDYTETGRRLLEIVQMIAIAAIVLLPVWILARLANGSLMALLLGRAEAGFALGAIAALALGLVLAVFAFGATGAHSSGLLLFRVDLHLEALFSKAGPAAIRAALGIAGLFGLRVLVGLLLAHLPLLGGLLSSLIGAYALVLAAHFTGLLFRRERATLDAIYRD